MAVAIYRQHSDGIKFLFLLHTAFSYHSSSQCAMPKRPKEEIGLYVNGILFGNRRRNSDSSDTEEVGVMVARNRDGTIDMSIVKEYVGKHRRDTKAGKTVHADSQQDDDTKAGETFHADSQQQDDDTKAGEKVHADSQLQDDDSIGWEIIRFGDSQPQDDDSIAGETIRLGDSQPQDDTKTCESRKEYAKSCYSDWFTSSSSSSSDESLCRDFRCRCNCACDKRPIDFRAMGQSTFDYLSRVFWCVSCDLPVGPGCCLAEELPRVEAWREGLCHMCRG